MHLTGDVPAARGPRSTSAAGPARRTLVAFVLAALCLSGGPAAAALAQTYANASAITINDATFVNNGPDIAGAATPYPSTISVAGLSGSLSDLDVTLTSLTHSYVEDVDVLLVGPGGEKLLVMSDIGLFCRASNATLRFDDGAAMLAPESDAFGTGCDFGNLASGTYRPTNYSGNDAEDAGDSFPAPAPGPAYDATLARFNGTSPNGTWSLYVVDDQSPDGGSIGGWSLTLTTHNEAPVAADDSYTTEQDTTLTVPAAGVLANDSDPDADALSALPVAGPSHGTLTLNADGSFSYRPNAGYSGGDSFTYKASDGSLESSAATVSLTVRKSGQTRPATPSAPSAVTPRGACALTSRGTRRPDRLLGTPFGDRLLGLRGNDGLLGLGGDDCLDGGPGADRLDGGQGADRLYGRSGADRLHGGSGDDNISGASGVDRISAGSGADRINPGSGDDRVTAGAGDDRISARGGARDKIDCGAGGVTSRSSTATTERAAASASGAASLTRPAPATAATGDPQLKDHPPPARSPGEQRASGRGTRTNGGGSLVTYRPQPNSRGCLRRLNFARGENDRICATRAPTESMRTQATTS